MAEKSSEQSEGAAAPKMGPLSAHPDPIPATVAVRGTPHEHAVALGAFKQRGLRAGSVALTSINGQSVSTDEYSWQHNAAAALHGWAEHEHHEAKPMHLSAEDYRAALLAASNPVTRVIGKDGKLGEKIDSHEAAAKGIPTHTDYEPHAPALSRFAAHSVAKKAKA